MEYYLQSCRAQSCCNCADNTLASCTFVTFNVLCFICSVLIMSVSLQYLQRLLERQPPPPPPPPPPPRGAMCGPNAAPAPLSWTRSASTSATWTSYGSTHLSKSPLCKCLNSRKMLYLSLGRLQIESVRRKQVFS